MYLFIHWLQTTTYYNVSFCYERKFSKKIMGHPFSGPKGDFREVSDQEWER